MLKFNKSNFYGGKNEQTWSHKFQDYPYCDAYKQLMPHFVTQLMPQMLPQNELNPKNLENRARLTLELIYEMTMEEVYQEVAED